jgi:hypothetical protein
VTLSEEPHAIAKACRERSTTMKVIGFEEHYKLPAIQEANRETVMVDRDQVEEVLS